MTTNVAREYSRDVIMNAEKHGQRTGQYLFNGLPQEVRAVITGTVWDPFHKNMSQYQVEEWLDGHLIFNDNGGICGVIAGRKILWGKKI